VHACGEEVTPHPVWQQAFLKREAAQGGRAAQELSQGAGCAGAECESREVERRDARRVEQSEKAELQLDL